jgi:hypothetical protein
MPAFRSRDAADLQRFCIPARDGAGIRRRSPPGGLARGLTVSDHAEGRWAVPPDGALVQGRDGDRMSPVAVIVGRARVELATVAELAAFLGSNAVHVVSLRRFQALPTRIADGTLVRGVVDQWGRVDLTSVALLAGGARLDFLDHFEVATCGYAGIPVRPIPSRVYRALPTVPVDGTLLRCPLGLGVYRVVSGCPRRIDVPAAGGDVWSVPTRVLGRLGAERFE